MFIKGCWLIVKNYLNSINCIAGQQTLINLFKLFIFIFTNPIIKIDNYINY